MQWSNATNGGFSTAAKRRLPRPLPDGLYGPDRVNAADQRHDHDSFWWFIRDLIYTYRQQPEIGWSTPEILTQPHSAVLAHACREASGWTMVGLHNFGAEGCLVPLQLGDVPAGCTLVDLLDGRDEFEVGDDGSIEMQLGPYGYRWLRLQRPGDPPLV